jgi:Bacterial Ig domain
LFSRILSRVRVSARTKKKFGSLSIRWSLVGLSAAAFAGGAARPAAASTTLTFTATADTSAYQVSSNSNYGGDTILEADGGSTTVESFLKFVTSGISGTIQSAKVQLTATSNGTADGPSIYSTGVSWSESTLTWNNRPSATSGALDKKTSVAANAVVTYDVTKAISPNASYYGFRLATTSTDGVDFYSREAGTTSQRPVLIVTFTTSGGDTTAPTVSLTSPANGATVSGNVAVSANATDNVGVTKVDFSVDGSLKSSDTSSPWGATIDTSPLSNGTHTITARAYDAAGHSAASSVSVTVSQPSGCTLYASPTGSASAAGTSPSTALTLDAATSKAQAGYTICLVAGTYSRSAPWYINRSGSAGKYIVFKNYGGTATIKWTGGAGTMISFVSGTHYVELRGLVIDAANKADHDVNCNTADHVRVIANTMMNGGALGFASYKCDYVTVSWNRIYHVGYNAGWGSGISLNYGRWADTAAGFHNFVTNNIVSGTYDNSSYRSDGNGIIIDRGGDVPPTLVANNLVYENYYRCIHSYLVKHVWVINNTCYKNGLRYNPPNDVAGEINTYGATDIHVINNIAYAWTPTRPYKQNSTSSVIYQHNAAYGGSMNEVPSPVLADPNQIRTVDPLFLNPLYVNPTASGQWATATPPWQVGTSFQVQTASPMINQGIDPRTAIGMTSALIAGINAYFTADLAGVPRMQSGAYDLGAYER